MSTESGVMTCDKCGATVYPEMVESGRAGMMAGKLECPHCYREDQEAAAKAVIEDAPAVALVDEAPATPPAAQATPAPKVTYTGGGIAFQRTMHDDAFQRPVDPTSRTATRCRTFHAKLTDASLQHLDDMINEWADAHDDVQIKFATSSIGIIEGKHADPHLIVTVWY